MNLFSIKKYLKKTKKIIDKSKPKLFSKIDFTDLSVCKPIKKYAFVFICQEGRLEIEALLLSASLKRFLKCEYELIAAIPLPIEIMGEPKEVTIELLKKMGVRIVNIYNEIALKNRVKKYYLITNKIYCLKILTSADKLIFMDSDILCYKDFYGDARFSIPFSAKKVGLGGTHPYKGKWYKFYDALSIEMPKIRIRVEYPAGFNYVPPYFSSSFVAINTDLALNFSDCWFECWETIEGRGLIKEQPYFTDQIALALAVCKMKIPYELIERDWLYSYFYNYDKLSHLKDNQEMTCFVQSLIQEYPEISKLLKDNSEWQFLRNY